MKEQLSQFDAGGLVSLDKKIYLLDYESMFLDDPAFDLGVILWWYYPPEMQNESIKKDPPGSIFRPGDHARLFPLNASSQFTLGYQGDGHGRISCTG